MAGSDIDDLDKGWEDAAPPSRAYASKFFTQSPPPSAPPQTLPQDRALTDFESELNWRFKDDRKAQAIINAMNALQIPIPQNQDEFVTSNDGILLASNRHGVVIRIDEVGKSACEPIDDHERFLRPLGSVDLGECRIEILPGIKFERSEEASYHLAESLKKHRVDYRDENVSNVGRLPVSTAEEPEGVLVVLDRISGRKMEGYKPSARPDAQDVLYGDLQKKFAMGWNNGQPVPGGMEAFWSATAEKRAEGKLVAGWNETPRDDGNFFKGQQVKEAAAAYQARPPAPGCEAPRQKTSVRPSPGMSLS